MGVLPDYSLCKPNVLATKNNGDPEGRVLILYNRRTEVSNHNKSRAKRPSPQYALIDAHQ